MAKRKPALGKHQRTIVQHLGEDLMHSEVLRKKTKLTSAQFEPALQRLAKRRIVHVSRVKSTAADGEVFKVRGSKLPSAATRRQNRMVILKRMGLIR